MVFGRWVMALMTEEREDLGGVCLDFPALAGGVCTKLKV
jgi:hypothetical protein